jgi:outer membrane receptor protein involved in Fe transport
MFTLERHLLSFVATRFLCDSSCATLFGEAQKSPQSDPGRPNRQGSGATVKHRFNTLLRPLSLMISLALLLLTLTPALAQDTGASLRGRIVSERGGLPISGASVSVAQSGKTVASGTTGNDGIFRITNIPAGIYDVTIRAASYDSSASNQLVLVSSVETIVNSALTLSATSSSSLRTIGRVASRSSLAAATTISQAISIDNLTRTGQIRVSDQLGTLPGVNFSSSSSVGDDASINLRGFNSDETAILIDGHPVGPLGVGSGGFNIALGPNFGLSGVNVTYGSGAQGLYGNDTIGGAVNFLTLAPTSRPHAEFQQQIGGFGTSSSGITATGTLDRLGYAIAAGTFGTYGDFAPTPIAQSARPNNVVSPSVNPNSACATATNDVSACNLALNTYVVSQNTTQKVGLAKFEYALGNTTKAQVTAYDGLQFADSTGNGDNDYLPYNVRLGQVLKGTSDCTTTGGTPGYTVTTNPLTTPNATACYTAQQFAASTYGPDGGGAGRNRGTRMGDYHGSVTTKLGVNNITVDGYLNNYVYYKNSSQAGGIDASGNFLGTKTYANYYNTKGVLIDDEIVNENNDLIFGYNLWHQLQTGNESDITGVRPNPNLFFGEWSGFIHDNYTFNKTVSTFVNANIKRSSVSQKTTFDPRATLQIRPTNNDVFQVTYGRSDGAPSPSLLQTTLPLNATNPGSSLTSVNCTGYNDVASGGDPTLLPESANDYEAGYGHRFSGDTNVQVNAYVTHVTDQIFAASEPLLQYGLGNIAFAPGTLQTYINRFNSQCGLNLTQQTVLNLLSVGTSFNAASALARGVEFSGRTRINRNAYVDYSYDIESSQKVGISNNILTNNPTVVNGAQLPGVPIHQASLSIGVTPGPWDFRLDNYFVDNNNGLNRPAYFHSNFFLTRSFNRGQTLVTLGGTNIFTQAVQVYGYLNSGTIHQQNAFATKAPTASEEFGLAPAQLTLTLQQRL